MVIFHSLQFRTLYSEEHNICYIFRRMDSTSKYEYNIIHYNHIYKGASALYDIKEKCFKPHLDISIF